MLLATVAPYLNNDDFDATSVERFVDSTAPRRDAAESVLRDMAQNPCLLCVGKAACQARRENTGDVADVDARKRA